MSRELSKEAEAKEEELTASSSFSEEQWIDWFLGIRGNEFYCDVDQEYIVDRFNLTGLSSEVSSLPPVIDLMVDTLSVDYEESQMQLIEFEAQHLYGLIHARYILTVRGLQKMLEKYKASDFGRCPRVHCQYQSLLPVGLYDMPRMATVKLYCPKCEDLYNPKSHRHLDIDGAYFGTSFPAMLLQVYPLLDPPRPTERYIPKIFGFNIHEYARLARWQEKERQKMEKRLEGYKQENVQRSAKQT